MNPSDCLETFAIQRKIYMTDEILFKHQQNINTFKLITWKKIFLSTNLLSLSTDLRSI